MNPRLFRFLTIALIAILLGGCMGNPAYQEGRDLAADGQDERALEKFQTATTENPGNGMYRAAYVRLRERLLSRWLDQGLTAQRAGKDDDAEKLFRRILDEDPTNTRARNGLSDILRGIRHRTLLAEAEAAMKRLDYDLAIARVRMILGENPEQARALELKRQITDKSTPNVSQPRLSDALRKPLTIEFKDAPLRQIFEVMSRTSGLNFVFDKDVRGDQRATIFLRNTSINDALNLLLLTNQLEHRVLDANSILIYPNTAAKLKDYQALTVKTFFLSNVDAKTAAATLKTIVRTKDIVVDEKQNLITIRDTPDAVRMAEKLLALHDLPEPEVMLEVTVLEVSRSRLLNLGIQWPDQLSLAPLAGAGGNVTLSDLRNLGSSTIGATITPFTINAKKTDGDTNILANPRIRARNKETAKIMIGDRIPNITTTSTATGFVSENIQYIDVGLKLEVQPTVYADNEVAIKISLEVSSIANTTQTKSGALAYQIGTRNASTVLRLKDGENQVLAGLIRDDESSTGNKVPGLGDIPLLGRLFGSKNDQNTKTEIILSITPHLIRDARRPDFGNTEFDSGSESMLRIRSDWSGAVPVSGQAAATSTSAPSNPSAQFTPSLHPTEPLPIGNGAKEAQSGQTDLLLQGPSQVKIGTDFSVQLAIKPGEPVSSIPLALTFDPKVFEVTGVVEGDFLKQAKGTTNFSNRVDRNGGQVFATVTRSGQDGASRQGNIVVIGFKALSPAKNSSIQITAVSPIGIEGRSVNAAPPSPLVVTVTP